MPVDYDPEDTHDKIDDGLGDVQKHNKNAGDAAEDVGKADQSLQKAHDDYQDDDQDAQDKADNMADGGSDALHHGSDALDHLGLGDAANKLDDVADALDGATDFLGKRQPVDGQGNPILPNTFYQLYFGKKGGLDMLKDGLIDGALDQADSLISKVGKNIPVLGAFTNDAVSSFMDDDTEPDRDPKEPHWGIVTVRLEEGINELFRCEIELSRMEVEAPFQVAAKSGGGLVDQLLGPVQQAMSVVDKAKDAIGSGLKTAKDLFSNPKSALDLLSGGSSGPDPAGPQPYVNVPLDPGAFLGQAVSVSFTRHLGDAERYPFTRRWVTGIISEFCDLGERRAVGAKDGDRRVKIVIVPELYRLTLRHDCRVFQNMTAIAIVRDVFREAEIYGMLPALPGVGAVTGFASGLASKIGGPIGDAASDALSGEFIECHPPEGLSEQEWTPRREMCVQYNETDLDFVLRLLAEEGINFFFEQEKGSERLVLMDDPTRLDLCNTIDGRAAPFEWAYDAMKPFVERVFSLAQEARVTTDGIVLRDYNFSDPAPTQLKAERASPRNVVSWHPGRLVYQFENDDKGPHYRQYQPKFPANTKEGQDRDYARLQLEAEISEAYQARLRTNLTCARPGTSVRLTGVMRPEVTYEDLTTGGLPELPVKHTFVVRRAIHMGHRVDGGARTDDGYENILTGHWSHESIDKRIPIRPTRAFPKQRIHGIQTATVVDDSGDESEDDAIHFDAPTLGRIRVRFHWDRYGDNPLHIDLPLIPLGKTAWVRVAQGWAGPDHGVTFLPRIGMEVVVSFVDGDPDRPLVVGCLYNGPNPPPFDKPELSGIKTRTNPLDEEATDNELLFDDKNDAERIRLHAARYLVEEVRWDQHTTVERNQKNEIKRGHGEIVEGKQHLTVDADRKVRVNGDEMITVHGHRTEEVGKENRVVISTYRKEVVKGRELLSVGNPEQVDDKRWMRTLVINGDRVTKIGEMPDKVRANDYLDVDMEKRDEIKLALSVVAGGLGVGQPAGERADRNEAGFGVAAGEHGPTVSVGAEKGVELEAKGKITIQSENLGVSFAATQKSGPTIRAVQGDNTLTMSTRGPKQTIELKGKKVIIESMHTTLARFEPNLAVLLAEGKAPEVIRVEPQKVLLTGETFVVAMDERIVLDGASGVHFASGSPPPVVTADLWDPPAGGK